MAIQSLFNSIASKNYFGKSKQPTTPSLNQYSLKGTLGPTKLATPNKNYNLNSPYSKPMTPAVPSVFNTPASKMQPLVSKTVAPVTQKSNYMGNSIVDYLSSIGQATDYGSRSQLAAQNGINNYVGSAAQNTQLLNSLRGQQGSTPATPALPAGTTTTPSGTNINPETGGVVNPPEAVPGTPAKPVLSAYDTAAADVEKYTKASDEEITAQAELNKISESLRQGYQGEGERAIPLGFITGRQSALETRAAGLSQPIQARAALAQAKRIAALDASKFRLEVEGKKLDSEKEAKQEGFTLSAGQRRYDAAGNLIASSAAETATGDSSSWVNLIKSGQASLSDVPNDLRNSVAENLSSSATLSQKSKDAISQAGVVINKINTVLPMISNMTTGLIGKASSKIPNTPAYNLEREIDTIKANVGFSALQAMRNASPTGGALGQVSEQENRLLQATLGSLDIGQSPDQLKQNLQNIMTHFNNLIGLLNAQGSGSTTGGGGQYDW
jgi:hypothetical protein